MVCFGKILAGQTGGAKNGRVCFRTPKLGSQILQAAPAEVVLLDKSRMRQRYVSDSYSQGLLNPTRVD